MVLKLKWYKKNTQIILNVQENKLCENLDWPN